MDRRGLFSAGAVLMKCHDVKLRPFAAYKPEKIGDPRSRLRAATYRTFSRMKKRTSHRGSLLPPVLPTCLHPPHSLWMIFDVSGFRLCSGSRLPCASVRGPRSRWRQKCQEDRCLVEELLREVLREGFSEDMFWLSIERILRKKRNPIPEHRYRECRSAFL